MNDKESFERSPDDAEKPQSETSTGALTPTRREFLTVAAGVGLALSTVAGSEVQAAPYYPPPVLSTPPVRLPMTAVPVTLNVNGVTQKLSVEPGVTLLDALRDRMGLPGTKKGCDHGQCGACTVHIGGRRVLSCLTLAIAAQGAAITTIEGLALNGALHPMQTAFLDHDAFQCGYCTPGQIMSAVGVVQEQHAQTDDEIREAMSGNICRCGAYPNIVAAVRQVMEGKSQ
jgi:xanthine dehydrogenase YagT iron-sulfur-binding subunit